MSVLSDLTASLEKDPRDPVTIQALADYLEEQGAAPYAVRQLTVDGPTVLVFQHPRLWPKIQHDALLASVNSVMSFLKEASPHPLLWIVTTDDVSIKTIKATHVDALSSKAD